jgi:hypothetical protein
VRNEANWRWQRTWALGGNGVPSSALCGQSRAGTPNLRRNASRRHYERAGGAILRNKANWRWQRNCALGGIGVPSPAPRGQSRAGTPNLQRNAWRRHYERVGEPIVRNKANCSRATREAGTWLKKNRDARDTHMATAKQSQWPHGQQAWARRRVGGASPTLRGRNRAGTANRRRGPPTVDRLRPVESLGVERRTQSSRVTANTPREEPACRAKRSQSGAARRASGGPLCETNPI